VPRLRHLRTVFGTAIERCLKHDTALAWPSRSRPVCLSPAETARIASEEARIATDAARQAVVDAVRATADTMNASLEQMKVVDEMRRTLREIKDVSKLDSN
jgi:hypothetical protein